MRAALVELNLQRQRWDIIICHLGCQQNPWHHPEPLQQGRDGLMDRGDSAGFIRHW